jgi:hypothetical protein
VQLRPEFDAAIKRVALDLGIERERANVSPLEADPQEPCRQKVRALDSPLWDIALLTILRRPGRRLDQGPGQRS